ncbi:MAG TPA: ABC transporter substrate-binding protein, partial [Myxococcaceae bacterium]|nr:ABC transporter substrate-binding protein [Myxococcaceae bacterium]
DKAFKSPKADKFEPIARVEAVDPRTVRFHLKRAYAPILADLSISIVPASRARMPGARAQDRTPIGAGPFRFISQPDEEHLELAPFDGYHGGKPALSALHFRVVRDETTRVLEMMKGRADLAFNVVSPAVIPLLSKQPRLRVLSKPGTGYAYVVLNTRSGPTADARVRQAVCHALAVDEIVEHKFHGLAVPATGMLPKDHWAYAPTPGCQRDLEKAGRLLDEAGYPARAGKPRLTLTLKTSTDRFRKSIGLVFKEELAKAGIEVEVRSLEFGTLLNDMRRGNFELGTLKWASVIEPDLLRQVFSSQYIPSQANGFGGLNRGGYQNPEVDELLAKASVSSMEERKAQYAEALRLIDRDVPYVPLWHESSVAVVSDRLQDFTPSAHGFLRPLANAREVAR